MSFPGGLLAGLCSAAILVVAPSAVAKPQRTRGPGEPAPDLVRFIECQASPQEYNGFALNFAGDKAKASRWGWKPLRLGDGLLSVYRLPKPIRVYGKPTSRIAFSGSGVVALLPAGLIGPLAHQLGLSSVHEGAGVKIYGKTISSVEETVGEQTITSSVKTSVSESEAYPQATLVGCSYTVSVN